MLVAFAGPTGAGRTSMMTELRDVHGYPIIRIVTTRSPRTQEQDRWNVSPAQFSDLEKAGEFIVVNDVHGFRYGTPRSVATALERRLPVELVDVPIETLPEISDWPGHWLTVLLLPPSPAALEQRLISCGRTGRIADARRQYAQCMRLASSMRAATGTLVLVNDVLTEAAEEVEAAIGRITG